MNIETPYAQATAKVLPEWIDYNGHMNVGYYHVAFDLAADPFFSWLGMTDEIRKNTDSSTFAVESHLTFLRELKRDDPLRFECRLIGADYKRIHFYQEVFHATEGYRAATYESVSIHMDMSIRKTAPWPSGMNERIQQVLAAHKGLDKPSALGQVMSAYPPKRTEN